MGYLKYYYPKANKQAVSLEQSISQAGNLIVNGDFACYVTNQCSFRSKGYAEQIAISSSSNCSNVTFTIIGKQKLNTISENITGPNNGTVYSEKFFDVVEQVKVSGAASNVMIGTGGLGAIIIYPFGKLYTLTVVSNEGNLPKISVCGSQDNIDSPSFTLDNGGEIVNPKTLFKVALEPNNLLDTQTAKVTGVDRFQSLIIGIKSQEDKSATIIIMIDN